MVDLSPTPWYGIRVPKNSYPPRRDDGIDPTKIGIMPSGQAGGLCLHLGSPDFRTPCPPSDFSPRISLERATGREIASLGRPIGGTRLLAGPAWGSPIG